MNLPNRPFSILVAAKGKMMACVAAIALAHPALAAEASGRGGQVKELEARLAASASATAVLGQWCADHHLAADPTIRAERDALQKPADRATKRLLHVDRADQLRYRHVRLMCGASLLSEADNWYRPDRLTPVMNTTLETTRTPFGVAVATLGFRRRTLSTRYLPVGSGAVLRHRALLTTAAGEPFSVVVETYTAEMLAPEVSPPRR